MKVCTECGKDNKDLKRKQCGSCRVRKSRKSTKIKAIEYLGGKCNECGYCKSNRALQFHHKDPTQKDFQISRASNPSWEKIERELNKCVLLCANCHAEEHEKLELLKLI